MASTTTTSTTPPTPTPQAILFARGVIARLAIWSTLRIAVQENWGGPEAKLKPTWIASTIVDSFESEQPDEEYIEEMLLQIMADEFEAVLEDDSAASVAKDIVKMWMETQEGREDTVRTYESLADRVKGKRMEVMEEVQSDDEDWEDDEGEGDLMDEDEEVPRLIEDSATPQAQSTKPIVDEDGFTMVKAKGKGRR